MEDFERYGDYDDIEDDYGGKKSPIVIILKILVAVVIISVVAILAFRLVLFNIYPDSMKNIYFNDKLEAYYNETDGNINALTQNMRAEYDDADEGNFFCGNLILIKDINQLQVSVRYNVALLDKIKEEYGITLPEDTDDGRDIFSYKLTLIPFTEGNPLIETGKLTVNLADSNLMYRYNKLVFDDVDFAVPGVSEHWLRLDIYINGVEMEKPYSVLIYEDTEEYSNFDEYKLSKEERPNK